MKKYIKNYNLFFTGLSGLIALALYVASIDESGSIKLSGGRIVSGLS